MYPSTYKAAIYHGPGNVTIEEKTLPEQVGPNDVIAKNVMATICGADFNAWRANGDAQQIWTEHEFGHEMVSEVVAKGENVTCVEIGDWIFPNLGYAYHDRGRMATVGGFSEYLYLPDFKLEGTFSIPHVDYQPSAIKLDKSLGAENLCLLEPFSVGAKAAKSVVGRGKTAVIIGGGIIVLSTGIMLKYYGFEKIMIVDFSDFRLNFARQYGLLTCNPKTEDLENVLFETFGKRGAYGGMKCCAEVFFDCIGIQPCIDYFFKHAGFGATLCIVGVHHKPVEIDAVSVCYNQQWIKGCGTENLDVVFNDICDMVRGGVDLTPLITSKWPVDQITEALETHGKFDVSQKVAIEYK
ncbi:MAG: alcohol dehydrogenase catalytic domain-containing protein [Mogibacterium sp.]|nr:alcohol dehydrogenase catalytic domain-containing protein [Mogibacterium sp.]